jgi:hypothetical protein
VGGAGGYQTGVQAANTSQLAGAVGVSHQNAVNANVPVSIAGGTVTGGTSTANQDADSAAKAKASNDAYTNQGQTQTQNVGGSSCSLGCGGAGGYQAGAQTANTQQGALSGAASDQNAVNANVPVSIAGGDVTGGSSNATQNADSSANAKASNDAATKQTQDQTQNVGGSSCKLGCGGAGAAQIGAQNANTEQGAAAAAKSDQNAVNANVPVSIAGGNVTGGSSTASQNADSSAKANASNDAGTTQNQTQTQNVGGGSCKLGCGGPGAAQIGVQKSNTEQGALSAAKSDQNAVNANAPVSIAGGNVTAGSSTANQDANSKADAKASNDAYTKQTQSQTQNVGGSSCDAGCGGAGAAQLGLQDANTEQGAFAAGVSKQNAVNGNAPVSIAGGDIYAGSSNATQYADSSAKAKASNDAYTNQTQDQTQNVGSGCGCKKDSRDSHDCGCSGGSGNGNGGAGGFQAGAQLANTGQWSGALALSDQNAVNGNAPVSIAGYDIYGGSSNATQDADSRAKAKSRNDAYTNQYARQAQLVG